MWNVNTKMLWGSANMIFIVNKDNTQCFLILN